MRMAEEKKKFCPLLTINSETLVPCHKNRCAWWIGDDENGVCVLELIAVSLAVQTKLLVEGIEVKEGEKE